MHSGHPSTADAAPEHGSQTAPLAVLMGEHTYFAWWRNECFRRPTTFEIRNAEAPGRIAVPRVTDRESLPLG